MFTFVGTGYTGRSLIESTTTQTSREEPALRITGCTSMLSLAAPESEPLQTFVAGAHGPVKLRARDSWSGQEHVCRMPSAHSWARRRTPCAEEARLDPHAAPAHERPAPPQTCGLCPDSQAVRAVKITLFPKVRGPSLCQILQTACDLGDQYKLIKTNPRLSKRKRT